MIKRVFMMGIGGAGMAPLALYLKDSGYLVRGRDDSLRQPAQGILREAGITYAADAFPEAGDVFVHTSAVGPGHPVYESALALGCPMYRRGEFVAEVVKDKRVVAITGSHGKTSTTGLLIHALKSVPCSYILGGFFMPGSYLPAAGKDSDWVVLEADESDGTMLALRPEITVVLNMDLDHHAKYKSETKLFEAWQQLIHQTRAYGVVPKGGGFDTGGLGITELEGVGSMMEQNQRAAEAVLEFMGFVGDAVDWKSFPGIAKRLETLVSVGQGRAVKLDYAHHPTEIRALIRQERLLSPGKRLLVIYEPHRNTRTQHLYRETAEALSEADCGMVLPIYEASEPTIEGVSSQLIVDLLPRDAFSLVPFDYDAVVEAIDGYDADLVYFVGAGTIELIARRYGREQLMHAFQVQVIRDHAEIEFRLNEPLAKKTTFRVGGNAEYYAEPGSIGELVTLLRLAKQYEVPVIVLGRGSNVVVPDEGIAGLVIKLGKGDFQAIEPVGEEIVWVGAGVRLKELCAFATKQGWDGYQFLEGIPGSLGGALRMNAGAMGGWMFDLVAEVTVLDLESLEVKTLSHDACRATYRNCPELERQWAIGAHLRVPVAQEVEALKAKVEAFSTKRKGSQPRESSAGCIFKNPEGDYAGRLIEHVGLKGAQVGGIEVSEVHANFMINRGEGSASEFFDLVNRVRRTVYDASGVVLEPEVQLVGTTWEEVLEQL